MPASNSCAEAHLLPFMKLNLLSALFQELLTKFREKKVDFAAHTQTEDGGSVFLNLLGRFQSVLCLNQGLSCSCNVLMYVP